MWLFCRVANSHALDLLLTQLINLLTHLKDITRILTQFYKIQNNLLFLITVRLSVTFIVFCFLAAESFVVNFIEVWFKYSIHHAKRTKLLQFSKFSLMCMPPFHHSKRTAITSIFFYMNRSFFIPNSIKIYFKILVTCLKIFSGSLTLYDPGGGGGFKSHLLRFFALTHLILELHYCALVTFPPK